MDPKNPTEAELNNQLYCLHEVFYPRDHWNNPGPFSSTQTRELLLFLQAAKDARLLKLREEIIETRRFEPFPAIGSLSEEELSLWRVAAQRRGARDMNDHRLKPVVSDYGSSRSGQPSADYLLRKAQTAEGVATEEPRRASAEQRGR